MTALERWSRVGILAASLLLGACGGGATLVKSTHRGGVVTYAFNPARGHMASPFRDDALALMARHCRGAFIIVREGEARGRVREVQTVAGAEVIEERRWGLEFNCQAIMQAPSSTVLPRDGGDPVPRED